MLQTRLRPSLIGSVALLLTAWAPRAAWAADECQTTADCDKGLECTVVSSGSCPGAPPCAAGATCPDPAPCEITEEKACTPAHCASDAECGNGWVCHAWTTSNCATSGCACASDQPNCDCAPSDDICTPEIERYCTPKYLLPCQAASDCGDGFDCVEQVTTTCSSGSGNASSGSGGGSDNPGSGDFAKPAPPPDGAEPAPLPEPDPAPTPDPSCTSEPSGVFQCVARELACDQASDCPPGWLCEQELAADLPACSGDGCPATSSTPPARRLCRPEYTSSNGGKGEDDSASPTSPVSGHDPGTAESANDADSDGSRESSACQMGRAPASRSAFSLAVALGALLALKRRRR